MRINRYVAASTGLSRRAADEAIVQNRVTIDGRIASPGSQVEPDDRVQLDNRDVVPPPTHTYIMLNKPVGYVSSRARQGSDPTIYALLPPAYHRLRPVGRLDRESSGLLLLSDDGDFIFRHTHPTQGHTKTYQLTLSRNFAPGDRELLEQGVKLQDGPSRVQVLDSHGPNITISISEGRNRQLRRTFGALGYGVEKLHRTMVGNYSIDELEPGKWREIVGDLATDGAGANPA